MNPLFLLVSLATVNLSESAVCSVAELRQSPNYRYRVERIRQFVHSATLIVRARALTEVPGPDSATRNPPREFVWSRVRFELLERLRGSDSLTHLELPGRLVDEDDFNPGTVPYTIVRRAGQYGDCYAREYRAGAEYLFILQSGPRGPTPQWKPLAPFNEQIRGADDPWVSWVRRQIAGSGSGVYGSRLGLSRARSRPA